MSFPIVALEAIPNPGLSVVVREWAVAPCGEGLGGAATRVEGELTLTRSGRRIVVDGRLAGAATVACDRCGEPLPLEIDGHVSCTYVPVSELAPKDTEEDDEAAEPAEESEYDGVSLDLVHVVREFFALERPVRVLCADFDGAADPECHARFRGRAHLAEPEPDPRFAALKTVKIHP